MPWCPPQGMNVILRHYLRSLLSPLSSLLSPLSSLLLHNDNCVFVFCIGFEYDGMLTREEILGVVQERHNSMMDALEAEKREEREEREEKEEREEREGREEREESESQSQSQSQSQSAAVESTGGGG